MKCSIPPDIHVSRFDRPDQSAQEDEERSWNDSIANGCLRWAGTSTPIEQTVDVYPSRALLPNACSADGFLDGAPVLPGFRLPVAEVFGWLVHRPKG